MAKWNNLDSWLRSCATGDNWSFSVERVAGDLYAWSDGRDTSLETMESLQDRLRSKFTGGTDGKLGGPALGGDRCKE
jgi:hypothetical protein